MCWQEIVEAGTRRPKDSIGGVKPLTPEQARARAEKQRKAQARVNDVSAANARRMKVAQRKLSDAKQT
jgi:hypothetical protein